MFSFHPVKTITTGEGGAITTNDPILYDRLLLLRTHGITKDVKKLSENPGPWYYEMQDLGFNYRMTDIQAALGISQLGKLDSFRQRRREIVDCYNRAFQETASITIPFEDSRVKSCFHLYVVQLNFEAIGMSRKEVMDNLRNNSIGTQVHYIPVHLQPYYRKRFGYRTGDFPVAETYYSRALSLPLFPAMTDEQTRWVIDGLKRLLREGKGE